MEKRKFNDDNKELERIRENLQYRRLMLMNERKSLWKVFLTGFRGLWNINRLPTHLSSSLAESQYQKEFSVVKGLDRRTSNHLRDKLRYFSDYGMGSLKDGTH